MTKELEEIIRAASASKSDTIEATAQAILGVVKEVGVISMMPSPALPLTGLLLMVHPDVYARARQLIREPDDD